MKRPTRRPPPERNPIDTQKALAQLRALYSKVTGAKPETKGFIEMIDALISGRLIRDPVTKTAANGKSFVNFLLSVPVGDEEPVIVSGIAFADAAERIGRLGKGDALAVTGSLKPSTWMDKATGEERHGLNVTVSACLSPYDVRKCRPAAEVSDEPKPRPARPAPGRRAAPATVSGDPVGNMRRVYAAADDFDDDLTF